MQQILIEDESNWINRRYLTLTSCFLVDEQMMQP